MEKNSNNEIQTLETPENEGSIEPNEGGSIRENSPFLSFSPKKLRIQISFTHKHCSESQAPPPELIARSRAKMHILEKAGDLVFFTIYERKLNRIWQRVRELDPEQVPELITATIAVGVPKLTGLEINIPDMGGSRATISIKANSVEVANWQVDWIRLHLLKTLRANKIRQVPNAAQIHGALFRAKAGYPIDNLEIKSNEALSRRGSQPFHLAVNRGRKEVSLIVFDLESVKDLQSIEDRIRKIEKAIGNIPKSSKSKFRILREHILEAIASARSGPERLGLNLPLIILAAIDPVPVAIPKQMTAPKIASHLPPSLPKLTFTVTNNRMSATIASDEMGFAKELKNLSAEWLQGELENSGIIFGIKTDLFSEIAVRLKNGLELRGLEVAKGVPPTQATEPYLNILREQESSGIDRFKAYLRHTLVRTGQLVAEIRYRSPAVVGKDVGGRAILPPPGEKSPDPIISDGLEITKNGEIQALSAGVVQFDGDWSISLIQMLIHEGNANLACGDITFEGPAEINGNIDGGARVKVSGDLIVRGEVCGGSIECGGNLVVERGIVVGLNGRVEVKGDVTADFVENSTIHCRGSLNVARSIMQSNIIAGGSITVASGDGLISGGMYSCHGSLRTGNLGRPEGSLTSLNVGTNVRAECSIQIRKKRLDTLLSQSEEDRRNFKVLMNKHVSRLSKVDKKLKDGLRIRIARWSKIIESAQLHLKKASEGLTFSSDAELHVSGALSTNCLITVRGKMIAIREDKAFVSISGVLENGSYFKPCTK